MNYYDLILALVPFTLLGLTGVLAVGGFTMTVAVPLAAAAAAGVVGHAMFLRPPVAAGIPEAPVEAVAR